MHKCYFGCIDSCCRVTINCLDRLTVDQHDSKIMSSDWYGEGKYVAQEWVLVSTKIVSWQRFSCQQLDDWHNSQ